MENPLSNLPRKSITGAATIAAAAALTFTPVNEARAASVCSNPFMNLASSMGMTMFNMASMIPFFGSMMQGVSTQMAGEFFKVVLADEQMTIDMIRCVKGNSSMIDMMIEVIDANPELLARMADIMRNNPEFTEAFTDLALSDSVLARFFFAKINSNLWDGMTKSMVNSTLATRNVATLMKKYAKDQMKSTTPFARLFFNLGTTTNPCDGSEASNERFIFAVFSDITAANSFLAALGTLDANTQKLMLDFVFQAKIPNNDGTFVQHSSQKYYYNYAIIKAFVKGVAPTYDVTQQPDPKSTNPANALFGNILPMLMTTTEQGMMPTENGLALFQALMMGYGAQDPACAGMMQFLSGMFPAEMFGMIPAPPADSPVPRDFTSSATCPTSATNGTGPAVGGGPVTGGGTTGGTTGGGTTGGTGGTTTNTSNLLLNCQASASDSKSASFPAKYVCDGSTSSAWVSRSIYNTSQTSYVNLYLNSGKTLKSLKINFAYPCNYTVTGMSTTGNVTLGSGSAQANALTTLSFPSAKFMTLKIDMKGGAKNSYFGISEIQGF